jgi:hypothetical protein
MRESQRTGQERSLNRRGLDLLLALLLFVVALGVRWQYVEAVTFPPLDDPAFYLITAENLVSGRGLEVDVLWSYHTLYPTVTHPSHEVWMPLTTGLIAAVFSVAEPSLRMGQLPGLILGALLVPFTYLFGRKALSGDKHNRAVAIGAALLVALNATLSYQSASVDSSAPFALLAALALATSIRKPGDQGGYLLTGLLIGLAYLTRAHGLLLLLAVPVAWWLLPGPKSPAVELPDKPEARFAWDHWPRERGSQTGRRTELGPSFLNLLDLLVGFGLVVAPWLVRNYMTFGTPLPGSALEQAWLSDHVDAFNYLSHPTWQTFLAQPWRAVVDLRVDALRHNANVFLVTTFAWGLLAVPGHWLLRRNWSFFPPLVYSVLLFLVTALVFPTASLTGMFYHSLGAVVPFLALAAVYAVQRGAQFLGRKRRLAGFASAVVTAGLLVLAGAQVHLSLTTVTEQHLADKEQFEAIAAWLSDNAAPGVVVMTTQPYTLNYVSGHPAIALPGNEPPDAAWEAAQRYGARYLVITGTHGLYPQILQDHPDPRFRLLEQQDRTMIYEIVGGRP